MENNKFYVLHIFFIIIVTFLSISYEKSNEMNNLFVFYMLLLLVDEAGMGVEEGREETRGRHVYNTNWSMTDQRFNQKGNSYTLNCVTLTV